MQETPITFATVTEMHIALERKRNKRRKNPNYRIGYGVAYNHFTPEDIKQINFALEDCRAKAEFEQNGCCRELWITFEA